MNASVFRKTRFELVSLVQGPNQFRVVAVSRTTPPTVNPSGGLIPPPAVTLEVHEDLFSNDEMVRVHAALEILEEKFAEAYDAWATAPERIDDAIRAAEAAKLEKSRLDMEMVQKRAEMADLEEQIAEKRKAVDP